MITEFVCRVDYLSGYGGTHSCRKLSSCYRALAFTLSLDLLLCGQVWIVWTRCRMLVIVFDWWSLLIFLQNRTRRLGWTLKILVLFLLPVPLILWPVVTIIGSILGGIGYGFFAPLIATFEAAGENVTEKFYHCFLVILCLSLRFLSFFNCIVENWYCLWW